MENKEFEYTIEEIESVEQDGMFEDEYVYDIEVNDPSHTFIGNDILIHNSAYTTYGNFFKCWTKESLKNIDNDQKKTEWILNFNKKFVDGQNNIWLNELYEPRHAKNIHEFELETISKAGIYLKKKKYLKELTYNNGKWLVDHPKISGTGIEIIKSTTPSLCREILTNLTSLLLHEYDNYNEKDFQLFFNSELMKWKKKFYTSKVDDISNSVGVGNYKKYVLDDTYSLRLDKGCPVSVTAIARFNFLAHKNNEDNNRVYSGKIKYYNINVGNKETSYFGFPSGECPKWAPKMDKKVQWEKNVIDPINRFLEVMNIPFVNSEGSIQTNFFDDLFS